MDNTAVARAFAFSRATMAAVILGTALLGGLNTERLSVLLVQGTVVVVAIVGLFLALGNLFRPSASSLEPAKVWIYIALDSVLSIGVMTVIDFETSPLAWVALIVPVLETVVFFSMIPAAAVWFGLSMAFLALRIATTDSDNTGSDMLVQAVQQVLAVFLVSGPAALMADNTQGRLAYLTDARTQADRSADHLRRVAQAAQRMSQADSEDAILQIASEGAVAIGFDQADIVMRSDDDTLELHSSHSIGDRRPVPLEILTPAVAEEDLVSINHEDLDCGEQLRLHKLGSGHALAISNQDDAANSGATAVLRAWTSAKNGQEPDLRALSLLARQTREVHRTAVRLKQATAHADQLQYEVRHDGLTGLANRSYLLERLEARIAAKAETALFFIDLDGFKSLNDTIGHRAGDAALISVGERLRQLAPGGCLVGRMGGDEFVVMAPIGESVSLEMLHRFGEALAQTISEPMFLEGQHAQLGASVGLAVHDQVIGADQLVSQADAAMYEAKRAGGGLRVDPGSLEPYRREASVS